MKRYSFLGIKSTNNRLSVFIISLIFLYPLFCMTRIKQMASPVVDMLPTTNEIWFIPLLFLIKLIVCDLKKNRFKLNAIIFVWFLVLFISILIGGFYVTDISQYLFAVAVFIIPISLLQLITTKDILNLFFFLRLFTCVCLFYSILYIILVSTFDTLSLILGNTIQTSRLISSDQFRVSLMIGSPISVANYFVITLPILFYMYFINKNNIWSKIALISIVANISATALTLSRLGFISSILVSVICILFLREEVPNRRKKLLMSIFGFIAFYFIASKYDLGRLFIGFSDTSTSARLESGKLALHLFQLYPFLGSGMGNYFTRVYQNNSLVIDGVYGLVDPHNAYLLVLSELGLVGIIIILFFLFYLIFRISQVPNKMFRNTGLIVLFSVSLVSIGGSHLINEISFSIVFWIYISLFYAASFLDEHTFQRFFEHER
ncbi:O-antigen ligase family protein [Bacillus sp. FJAT-29953]|nr:O-antigen ligase family protein [Bacillus sp. FJAT-29953]